MHVLRSGFPVNFDNSLESVPSHDIQLTRGLIFGAVLQACDLLQQTVTAFPRNVMLDPLIQELVLNTWGEATGRVANLSVQSIEAHSRGKRFPCGVLS